MEVTSWLKDLGANPVCDWGGVPLTNKGEPVSYESISFKEMKRQKLYHSDGKTKYLLFEYDQFPYAERCAVKVTWEQSTDPSKMVSLAFDHVSDVGLLTVHPFTFCRMIREVYGSDAAFDFLKLMMKDRIDNLARKYFSE